MTEKDVTLVNAKTNETPQVLASGQVDAIGAWQPIAGQAHESGARLAPDLHLAQSAGLIYDVLAVQPGEPRRAQRRLDEGDQGVGPCGPIHQRSQDPARCGQDHGGQRVGLTPEAYQAAAQGHATDRCRRRQERSSRRAPGFKSLYGSSKIADDFNVKNGVYKDAAGHRQLHRSVVDRSREAIATSSRSLALRGRGADDADQRKMVPGAEPDFAARKRTLLGCLFLRAARR